MTINSMSNEWLNDEFAIYANARLKFILLNRKTEEFKGNPLGFLEFLKEQVQIFTLDDEDTTSNTDITPF